MKSAASGKYLNCPFSLFQVVYGLLSGKGIPVYNVFWEAVTRAAPNLSPEFVTLDFEKAAINSLQETFPDANLQGILIKKS